MIWAAYRQDFRLLHLTLTHALYKMINEDYDDYEADALEAAKQELNKRIASNEVVEDSSDLILENITEEIIENDFDESEYDIEAVKSRLTTLPEDEIRDIIYKKYNDYRKSVIRAAKDELYSRNRDILDMNDSEYIQLDDVFSKVDFDKVLKAITIIYPDEIENIDSYKQVLSHLAEIKPTEDTNILIGIDKNDIDGEYWNVFGVDLGKNENFGVEFFRWNEWLAFRLPKDLVLKYGRENIVAHCLLKMTSNGFNEDEIQQQLTEMENEVVGEIDDFERQINPIVMPSQNASFDNVIARGIEIRKEIFGEKDVPQVRPWVRMWARSIDSMIWGTLLYIIWYSISPKTYNLFNSFWKYISIFPLFWTLIEALLLSTWGTTPGKWILNVFVRELTGEKLTFNRALYRSLFVWSCGDGCGIQYLGLIANIVSYFRLTNKGVTWWDGKGQFIVSHKKIGIYRSLIAVATIISLMLLSYFSRKLMHLL
mgnify:CR=1 FL=1